MHHSPKFRGPMITTAPRPTGIPASATGSPEPRPQRREVGGRSITCVLPVLIGSAPWQHARHQ